MSDYDVIVIGAGPGGYVAAIACAQKGKKVACIEKWQNSEGKTVAGGTCLNVGCIPSKALLEASHKYADFPKLKDQGIEVTANLDIAKMINHKDGVVKQLNQGIAGLLKANKVEFVEGTGKVTATNEVSVTDKDGNTNKLSAANIIIATGSQPFELPNIPFNHDSIVDNAGALAFNEVPKNLVVIGAGVIGVELGSVWSRLGSNVTILEAADSFLPTADQQLAKEMHKYLKKQGLKIELSAMVSAATVKGSVVEIEYTQNNNQQTIQADKLIVAVGRKPHTKEIVDPAVGVELDDRGFIKVDENCQTAVSNIYAIGDIVRGPMLAHKASQEAEVVASLIAGKFSQVNYDAIPNVIYTYPEFAWVGKTEQELKDAGVEYKKGVCPLAAIGRALANNDTQGMAKVLVDKNTDQVLGVHILGAHAGEIIAQGVTSLEFSSSAEDIGLTSFAHPTLSEAVKEAALATGGHAIHLVNR
ncbi:dihydrolipoyl dehydrogenase [Gammaproteobacteria bacterium]|nr:dihydrolipoyl dehydrogenase [Gammaproteobacteria bacterium]